MWAVSFEAAVQHCSYDNMLQEGLVICGHCIAHS